jgi:cyclic pyranopterin phosphate synthase
MQHGQPRPSLVDPFGRRISYVRVSVTDRCDLRCTYCMPEHFKGFEEPANWLTHDEMARIVGLFVRLGVSKVRITGGEPLTRRGVADFAVQVASLPGLQDGVRRLNVSLDALDAAEVAAITGRDCLDDVLAGLQAAREQGFSPIKLNCVVHDDTPEARLEALLDYAIANGFILRLIETMPMGSTARRFKPANLTQLGQRIAQRHGLVPSLDVSGSGPARYWATGQGEFAHPVLGVITPMSQHFCEACNRVRLTVDGQLHLCLGQENRVPLGQLMREGADDEALIAHIRAGIANKPERHEFNTATERVVRFMSQTGG